ncbi:Zinc finger BED domain containing protein 4 [Dissostichus eleginoides]|uniref:Zinc finger BED domain containing protein 4 n=1 Tax=Dissostichus eleginoides TaxID=100907 RepID=A0AAD9B9B5_DISEL|nr:Zinc finger BED domain containing protein 4 [Dissostichus eleginoides]
MPKTSAVWDHFKLDDDKKKAVCQICDKKLAYHSGTTTLKSHLDAVHPHASQPSTSSTIQQTLQSQKPITEKRKREITDAIEDFIAMDMRPIYIVEGEGFRKLMKKMEPGYTVPKRSSILDAMSLKYSDHRDQIVTHIEN